MARSCDNRVDAIGQSARGAHQPLASFPDSDCVVCTAAVGCGATVRGDPPWPTRAMKLSELIHDKLVELPLRAADKWEALATIARVPVRAGCYSEELVEEVERALVVREKSMTTGMEHGIAIPHAAIDGIDDLVAVLGLNPSGIPFETLDGEPARIVIGLIIPRSKKLAHIKTLAEIAKLLSKAEVRERLLACSTPSEAVQALAELQGVVR